MTLGTDPNPLNGQRPVPAEAAPDKAEPAERHRLDVAARHAERAIGGPIAELLARELRAWKTLGYVLPDGSLAARVADHILSLPIPPDPA